MDISFQDDRFAKQCSQGKILQRRQGRVRARKILQRLKTLGAAATLADMRDFPGRCHELKGDRVGQLALDLVTLIGLFLNLITILYQQR